jgi:hypothetical protein
MNILWRLRHMTWARTQRKHTQRQQIKRLCWSQSQLLHLTTQGSQKERAQKHVPSGKTI